MRRPDKVTFPTDSAGKVRWKIVAGNGRVVDSSSQGFTRKSSATRNLARVSRALVAFLEAQRLPESP